VTFTAGIGENSSNVRAKVCGKLRNMLGLALDEAANKERSKADRLISAPGSRTAACVVPTNEELMIARYTAGIVGGV
jgi:acetate kinase